jgi:hypothetical protein
MCMYSCLLTRTSTMTSQNIYLPIVCKFCCHASDSSRRAVWQNDTSRGIAYEAEGCHWICPCRKNCTCWHSSTLAERLWRPKSGCERSEAVGGAFQQWWQWCERQATFQMALHSCQLTKWRACRSAHPCQSLDNDQGTLYGPECQTNCVGNDVGDIALSRSLSGEPRGCSHRNIKTTKCKSAKTCWTVLPHALYSLALCTVQWKMDYASNIFLTVTPSS